MLDLAVSLLTRLHAGERVAVVTVVRVHRSAPRGVGASMAVTASGEVIGSISGGCVEGDSVMLAMEALRTDAGQAGSFGFSDDVAHAAGLACGGSVAVVAYPVHADDALAMDALQRAGNGAAVTVGLVTTGERIGCLVPAASVSDSDPAVLVLSHRPKPRLIILGAGEHAAALCRIGSATGFAVTVCDAWPLLVTPARFPGADELVAGMPHEYLASLESAGLDERTAVCVLTHDERLDVPALRMALRMPVGFVGAMGARSTVARREALLRQGGVTDDELARLHSPLGLDLGGSTPDEVAISVLAEIVAARSGGTGLALRTLSGPLHRSQTADAVSSPAATADGVSCTVSA